MIKRGSNHKHKILHLVASTVFAIVTLVHAIRLGYMFPLVIAGWEAPILLSWIGVFLAGTLSVLFWKTAHD